MIARPQGRTGKPAASGLFFIPVMDISGNN
jgi:hypothetical protein